MPSPYENTSYSTPDYNTQPTIATGEMFCREYDFTESLAQDEYIILDRLPYFPIRACGGALDLTAGVVSTGALQVGYGTYDGTTLTPVDADFFSASLAAVAAARVPLAPGYSTSDAARKPEGSYVIFVQSTGADTGTFTGHLVVLMAG